MPHRLLPVARVRATALPGTEILASVCAVAIQDALRIWLATLVVRSRVVVLAAETDMEVCAAAITDGSKADGLSRGERDFRLTGGTFHCASLRQLRGSCHRSPSSRAEAKGGPDSYSQIPGGTKCPLASLVSNQSVR
jgi:hypothetical protein